MSFSFGAGVRDGLSNLAASLGTGRDKAAHDAFAVAELGRAQVESMYRGDWLARKPCVALVVGAPGRRGAGRVAEAQLVADGTYPNAAALPVEEGGAAATVDAAPTLDFSPTQPRDPDSRWTGMGGAGPFTSPKAPTSKSEPDLSVGVQTSQAPDGTPVTMVQQTCAEFIAANCRAGILRSFPVSISISPCPKFTGTRPGAALLPGKRRNYSIKIGSESEAGSLSMSDVLFQILRLLEKDRVYFRLARTRPDTIQIDAHFVGVRVEIEVFEDGHVEMSKFLGNEDVDSGGFDMVEDIVKKYEY